MRLQGFLHTDPAVCSELAFQISSLRMYKKSACDHFPHLILLQICIQFLHSTETAKMNYVSIRFLFWPLPQPLRYI